MKQIKSTPHQKKAIGEYTHFREKPEYNGKGVKLCEISIPISELFPAEDKMMIPVLDIKWMTDEQWVELAASEENQRLLKKYGWVKDENGHWHPPTEERTER